MISCHTVFAFIKRSAISVAACDPIYIAATTVQLSESMLDVNKATDAITKAISFLLTHLDKNKSICSFLLISIICLT